MNTATLDVTKIEPRLKHPTIFEHFDALLPGGTFTIHNDHDPKPLYYQLLGERGAIFTWEYLQEGPESWLVQISKNQADKSGEIETVGSIAAKDYRKAEVFKKFGIDFCCGGDKSLKAASEEAGISEELLKAELDKADTYTTTASQDYDQWDLDFLSDFIKNTHHKYVKESAPVLTGLAEKVALAHGTEQPELFDLAKRVKGLMDDLLDHVVKEETLVFPRIKAMVNSGVESSQANSAESLDTTIKLMHEEHDHAGDDLRYMRKITNDYTLPAGACNSYTYLFEKLKEFENDLFLHIHLENNILFPKSTALESA